MRQIGQVLLAVVMVLALVAVADQAQAVVTVLTFEGLQDQEGVANFYNGGTGTLGSSGTNFGIGFGAASLALIDADAGGGGNFANEPSPSTILFFLSGSAIVNVAAGFDTGFSFFYTSVNDPGTVTVYDGLDGTGNILAQLDLPALGANCSGDPNGGFCNWAPIGVGFAGVARSIDFAGTANFIGFDDVTFGSTTPVTVPAPAALLMLGAGLGGIAVRRLRRP